MERRISDRTVDAIRAAVVLEGVIGERTPLVRSGLDSMKAVCPVHGERTPSLHVRPSRQRFHCFGCGAGGDAFDFIQAVDGVSRIESVEILADRAGLVIDYEDRDQ
ncbi:CHC2 zinc finger domain-containing protein [Rhodococcus ruber]|uniref:CHC2 zinc finger domain-containing protein n=1 Tax=Rhodococcus ruber TaxID=1830 RepID=A0ABT4MMH6_9NOCA|nr:CHC2 zinc finger domain-containing protein [Rhodococcus ruber]MCZ4522201.1 CHC2 zinc finger domain-containing protein [Rhodococcus ruber]